MVNFYKNKTIIITGASSGIGLASAKKFASMGANVVLAARSLDKLEKIASDLNKKFAAQGSQLIAHCIKTDVTKEEDCKNLIDQTVRHFGKIDVLVNNAGISMRAVFKDLDLTVMKSLMDTNFWGTVYCTKYALPYLL